MKSTWDYHNHLGQFLNWLEKLPIKVLNPVEIIKWNSHKRYLKDFEKKRIPVIPAGYLDKGTTFDHGFFDLFATEKLVVKPCVSAGAQNTIRLDRINYQQYVAKIEELLEVEDYLVQPFVEEIKQGEWSFLFFNGVYSHCALKTPKQGDFRVQHYHGGTITYPTPMAEHVKQAEKFVKNLSHPTLHARVDGVIIDGTFQLMELELIEPYLFFNNDKRLLENYYQALKLM